MSKTRVGGAHNQIRFAFINQGIYKNLMNTPVMYVKINTLHASRSLILVAHT